jgi:hypothetical protein
MLAERFIPLIAAGAVFIEEKLTGLAFEQRYLRQSAWRKFSKASEGS